MGDNGLEDISLKRRIQEKFSFFSIQHEKTETIRGNANAVAGGLNWGIRRVHS